MAFDAPINPLSIFYILAFNIFFMSSIFLFNWKAAFLRNMRKPTALEVYGTKSFRFCFYISVTISVSTLLLSLLDLGVSFSDLVSNPMVVAGKYVSKNYAGEIAPTFFSRLGLSTSYTTIVLGGLLYGALQNNRLLVLLLSFLPSLLVMVSQSAKGLFFFSIFAFSGGILVARIYNKNYSLLNLSTIFNTLLLALAVLPLVLMSFLSRGLQNVDDAELIFSKLKFYIVSYSSGHLYGFSDWFSSRYFSDSTLMYIQEKYALGFYTLMPFFRLLGDERKISIGVYDEYFVYGDVFKSNIYTVFRGIITDFTLFGSLIVACFLGFVCNLMYYRLLCAKENSFYTVFFIFFVACSYQTYVISSLMWLTIPVVFSALVLFFLVYYKYNRSVTAA